MTAADGVHPGAPGDRSGVPGGHPLAVGPDPSDPARLLLETARTCDRLRSMSLVRLSAALPEGSNRAHAAFALAGDFADRAADLAGRPRRALPELPDPAAGDVLSVCGNDLAEELRAAPADPLGAAAICRTAVAELVALRRLL